MMTLKEGNEQWHKEQAAACAWYLSKVISGGIPREQWESDGFREFGGEWTLRDEIEASLKDLNDHLNSMDIMRDCEVPL